MSARAFFVTDAGTLRAPWRLFIFVLAAIVGVILTTSVTAPIFAFVFRHTGVRADAIEYWGGMLGLLAATSFMIRVIDKRPWSDVWLGPDALRPRLLVLAFAIGVAAIGIPTVTLIVAHWLRREGAAGGSWIVAAIHVSVMLVPAALAEELLTRGYALSVLRDAIGWRWAIVLTSVGFGLMHLRNPDATVRSLGLVVLAGFFLGGVVWATKSLYAAWMTHLAWNWTMAVLFHVSVSGISMEAPGYRYVDAGPTWATGGLWGPEGGIPAGGGMGVGMGLTYLLARRERRRAA